MEKIMMEKIILDACCGSRMFWFDKENPDVLFSDIREEQHVLCDGRILEIKPDVIADVTNLPFETGSFKVVVLDLPHMKDIGKSSWLAKKYGFLPPPQWQPFIKAAFDECLRVLEPYGLIVFKWNEYQIPVREILKVIGKQPLIGHKSGKQALTHWMLFMK